MKHISAHFLLLFLALSVCFLGSNSAFAADVSAGIGADSVNEIKPLNYDVTMTQEEFMDQTVLYEEKPFSDRSLIFNVRLPKDWMKLSEDELENLELNSYLLGDLSKFVSPPIGEERAFFTVQALDISSYKTIDKWFLQYMANRGLYIDGMKIVSKNMVQAEYNSFDGEFAYRVRAIVQRNGARVILSEYSVPVSVEKESRNTQLWSMALFRQPNVINDFGELAQEFKYLNMAKQLYPTGWAPKAGDYDTVDDIFFTFARARRSMVEGEWVEKGIDVSKGKVATFLVSKKIVSDVREKINSIIGDIENYNVEDKKLTSIDRGRGSLDKVVKYNPIEVYRSAEGVDKVSNELWLSYNETSQHFFISYMLMPDRRFDPVLWADNVGAFQMMMDSFRPL